VTNTGAFTLTWTAASDPDAGDAVTYTLEHHDASPAAPWSPVATGLASPSYAFGPGDAEPEGTWSYRVTATDNHGASGPATVSTTPVVVDKAAPPAPALTVAAGQTSVQVGGIDWYRDAVTIDIGALPDPALSDGSPGSGVDAASYAPAVVLSANGVNTLSAHVTDVAGNASAAATRQVHVDAQPPTVTPACPASASLHGQASVAATAHDGESGLAIDPSGTYPVDTSSVGPKTFTFEATDRVGHLASTSCTVQVTYRFGGFDGRMGSGEPYDGRVGRSIAVRITLLDQQNRPIDGAVPTLDIAPVQGGVVGTYGPATSDSQRGNTMTSTTRGRTPSGGYTFDLRTSGLASGLYSLRVNLDDGTSYSALVSLR